MIGVRVASSEEISGCSSHGYDVIGSRREIEDALGIKPEYIGDDNCRFVWNLVLDDGTVFYISDRGHRMRLWIFGWKGTDEFPSRLLEFMKERGLTIHSIKL